MPSTSSKVAVQPAAVTHWQRRALCECDAKTAQCLLSLTAVCQLQAGLWMHPKTTVAHSFEVEVEGAY